VVPQTAPVLVGLPTVRARNGPAEVRTFYVTARVTPIAENEAAHGASELARVVGAGQEDVANVRHCNERGKVKYYVRKVV
jgi:hypothetical protein